MMNINKALRGVGIERIESGDVKASSQELAASFRRVSEASTREIEKLVAQLQALRTQLESAGNRIERDIAQYTELSQQTTQLTSIISDSVNKLPDGARMRQPWH
jgi:uncharacterized protein involved in exopolysaccharide biosynthesis